MKCSIEVVNRIKRTEGQIKGILKMIEEERTCSDVTTQLKAIESSIRKAITLLSIENLANKVSDKHNVDIKEFEEEITLILNR